MLGFDGRTQALDILVGTAGQVAFGDVGGVELALRCEQVAAAQQTVVLSRNGREYPHTASNVRAGTEIKVTTERQTMSINLTEMDAGSWVIFELPGFTTAASGTEQSSLDALRTSTVTSYYTCPARNSPPPKPRQA